MDEWRQYNLDQIYQFSSGLSKPADQFGFGYPFLSFKEVFGNYFLPRQLTQLVNSTEKERASGSIKRGDVFITRTSETDDDLGMTSVALKDYPDATFNGFTKRMRPKGTAEILPEFAGYYFRAKRFQAEIAGMSSVTTRASLNNGMLATLKMNLPPLPEQKGIAEVLSSLDDKIDLLHRQNKTLESLAQTLFRQWFIEEADGQVGKLSDVIELHYGKTLKQESRTGDGFPVVGSNGIIGYHSEYLIEAPGIVIGRKGTLGKVVYLNDNFFPIDTTYFIKSKTESEGLFYEYFLLKTLNFEEMNSDSAVPGLNRDIALATEIHIASDKRRNEFNAQCFDLFHKKQQNTEQIQTLIKLRDSLLPNLMSRTLTMRN